MTADPKMLLRRAAAGLAITAALATAACDGGIEDQARRAVGVQATALPSLPATLPLADGAAEPIGYAPRVEALPFPEREVPTVRTASSSEGYAYADRAYGLVDALGDAPPDYGIEYDDDDAWGDPYAWEAYDQSLVYSEPVEGGYRSYFYEPGAETPYFVRDPLGGYGYDGWQLAAVYGAGGGLIASGDYGARAGHAGRYLQRGRELRRAGGNRRPVRAANWVGQRPAIMASRARWGQARARQPEWVAYAQANAPRRQQHWREEGVRRQADSRRFGQWQQDGFRTPPPPRAIPAAWQGAQWARDTRRYSAPTTAAVMRDRRQERLEERWREQSRRSTENRRVEADELREARLAAMATRRAGVIDGRRAERSIDAGQVRAAPNATREQRRDDRVRERALAPEQRRPDQVTAPRIERDQARATRLREREQAHAARADQMRQRDQTRAAAGQREQARAAQAGQREQARAIRVQQEQARAAQGQQREQARADRARQEQAQQREQAQAARAAQGQQREQARAARARQEQARAVEGQRREQAQAARAQQREAQAAQAGQREQARAAQAQAREQARAARVEARAQARPERAAVGGPRRER